MTAGQATTRSVRRRPPYALLLAPAILLVAGTGLVLWWMRVVDRNLRRDLLMHTRHVARAVNAQAVLALTGTEADLASPRYRRLKTQLSLARPVLPGSRFLYLMGRRGDDTLFFYADSEPPESAAYSPPGQIYQEASEVFRQAFTSGASATEGPIDDRWGSWVSAFAPVMDPRSNRVLAVVGLDVDAARWQSMVAGRVVPLGLMVLSLVLLTAAGLGFIRRRARVPPERHGWLMRHAEVVLSATVGSVATGVLVYLSHAAEQRAHEATFMSLASSEAEAVAAAMATIRNDELEGLARFFEASEFVDRNEFAHYADFLVRQPLAQAWEWAPAVPAAERERFEQNVRAGGAPAFAIWEKDGHGGIRPAAVRDVYYPVCYVAPLVGNEAVLGYDLGSDPTRQAALEAARRTGLMTASDPVTLHAGRRRGHGMVVVRPVWSRIDTNRFDGFAVAALEMETLLARARGTRIADVPVDVELQLLRAEAPPRSLGAASGRRPPAAGLSLRVPVFLFGQTFAIVCRPRSSFTRLYPPRVAGRAALAGLALTTLVSLLLGFQRSRQRTLERLVAARTSELRRSESSYRGLFDSIHQAIYILDENGVFIDVNAGAVAMYGYAREEFVGKTPADISAEGRNDLEANRENLRRALAGEPQFFPFWGRRKDGPIFPKDVWLCPGTYFGRKVVIAVANDTSERTRAEAERERLRAQLQQAQKMESIGRLAGGVAHDFNNMLQAILGNASLALEEHPTGDVRACLIEIQRSAERSADLTRQLLAFASRQTAMPRVLDLNEAVAEALKMLRRLIGEHIQVRWTPGADLWAVKLDPAQVDQIMANLVVNARDAIDVAGEISVETANITCGPGRACLEEWPGCTPGDYVRLVVSDNGRGMDEETRAHLFEPFFTTKEQGQGVGLGLATVFGIVRQNRGFIHARSAPGQGCTLTIGFPRAAATAPAAPASPAAPPPASPPPRHGATILLVEDEKAILDLGRQALARLGYRVLAAGSSAQALEIAATHDGAIHLLLTDVVLPEMNGRELADRLTAQRPGLQCLFISGYTADIMAQHGVLDEGVRLVQKPFRLEDLAARVREVLGDSASA